VHSLRDLSRLKMSPVRAPRDQLAPAARPVG
jgi:hypothetical protein